MRSASYGSIEGDRQRRVPAHEIEPGKFVALSPPLRRQM